MHTKLKVIAVTVLIVFCFPQTARAEREFIARFHTDGEAHTLVYDALDFADGFTDNERAWVVFYNLLCMGESEFVPRGVRLLGVTLQGRDLVVNVSDEIKNYGGNYNEKHLRAQIALTGLELRFADTVTLLINGDPGVLPEGSTVNRIDEWDELMD